MSLVLSDEQRMLGRSARDFVTGRSSLKRVRTAREEGEGFSRELWREMARLGWLGLVLPEEHGGAGLGRTYLMVVLEELGRGLCPEPLLPTVLLGGAALVAGGTAACQKEHLQAMAAGERLLALAYQEPGSRYSLTHVTTAAERVDGGYRLRGEKIQVQGGGAADVLIVSARTHGEPTDALGVTLFAVPANISGPGVRRERQRLLDGRDATRVQLDGVRVGPDAVVGVPEEGALLLGDVIDGATIGLCAEMVGSMDAAFAMTLDYLKTRVQFGVPIGSFQALQHRAARLYIEIELARAAVLEAHAVFDDGADREARSLAASMAKAKCSDAFLQVTHEGIQMHGGIGMTEEHDMGLFVKRARVAQMTFGDAAFHRDRFARLSGY
ncbi:MAG TPA: acyl-CoA dehydrogenase [Polyangia bacterium]|jgi:acyl-CoA dehydrogenase|nr:acyl-CoA dehydrogenase [Polyangia bacterium]